MNFELAMAYCAHYVQFAICLVVVGRYFGQRTLYVVSVAELVFDYISMLCDVCSYFWTVLEGDSVLRFKLFEDF